MECPGLIDERGQVRDLSAHIPDICGRSLEPDMLETLAKLDPVSLPLAPRDARIGPCLGGAFKIIGVGMNYRCHLERAGRSEPEVPTLFSKALSSVCGPDDPILLPTGSTGLDWEVELGVVIGKETRAVSAKDARDAIAGYCVVNDLTERKWIARSGQLFDGKNGDTFTPIGPWLVTADEVPDPQNLLMTLETNGQPMQAGTTADMIFSIAFLISHISALTPLHPGDLIVTGTPAGIGALENPPRYLAAGDRIRLGIEGLGEQNQSVIHASL